jgi:hypothetical protein
MNRARIVYFLAVCLAAPCLAYAQSGQEKKPSPEPPPAAGRSQMQEDVEVMRRILNRSLDLPRHSTRAVWVPNQVDLNTLVNPGWGGVGHSVGGGLYGNVGGGIGGLSGVTTGWGGQNVSVPTVTHPAAEGVYLKGHGVIYTITLPPQQNVKSNADLSSKDKPLSEWDRVRKEVRGEKVDETDKPKKNPTVLDTVLKVLAENGTHLSQLGPDETVTIVVTFRESEDAQSPNWNAIYQWAPVSDSNALPFGDPLQFHLGNDPTGDDVTSLIKAARDADKGANAAQSKEVTGTAAKEAPAAAKDNILLGELSLKQGKVKEALKAYEAALKLLESSPNDASLVQVHQGLAQALLADGKFEEAKKHVENALALYKATGNNSNKPKKEAKAPATVATKLVVSAPKKVLDGVASGKITIEEFKKEVTVDYSDVASVEKKDGK